MTSKEQGTARDATAPRDSQAGAAFTNPLRTLESEFVVDELRALPSVSALLKDRALQHLIHEHGQHAVVEALRTILCNARSKLAQKHPVRLGIRQIERELLLLKRGSLCPVLNATGVIIHTNLGRAPLAEQALRAIEEVASGYSTLEYDLETGRRGNRSSHTVDLLTAATGAEDALVVNNNAAAILLALSACASGRQVITSRGELVEIGGGFRIPDVLAQSGARLREVGTTNKTRLDDYRKALTPDTALILKVHRSNFDMVGFTAEVDLASLATLAHDNGLPLFYDAGSGNLLQLPLPSSETFVTRALRAGADLVMFSGDKLLGGPQAGILVGHTRWIAPMRQHPLMRALRPDKLCLAGLRATLLLLRDEPLAVPVVAMLRTELAELTLRSERVVQAIRASGHEDAAVVPSEGRIGGGAAPSHVLESRAVRLGSADAVGLCQALRLGEPAVVARIDDGATLLDLRCIQAKHDSALIAAVLAALERSPERETA